MLRHAVGTSRKTVWCPRMNAILRPLLLACSCVGAAGCVILPAAGLGLAAQGAQGLVALTLVPLANMQERSEKDRCVAYGNVA